MEKACPNGNLQAGPKVKNVKGIVLFSYCDPDKPCKIETEIVARRIDQRKWKATLLILYSIV